MGTRTRTCCTRVVLASFAFCKRAYIASERFLSPGTDSQFFLAVSAGPLLIVPETALSWPLEPLSNRVQLTAELFWRYNRATDASHSRYKAWSVRDRRSARCGWDGRGVPRQRYAAGPQRRSQDSTRAVLRGSHPQAALRA